MDIKKFKKELSKRGEHLLHCSDKKIEEYLLLQEEKTRIVRKFDEDIKKIDKKIQESFFYTLDSPAYCVGLEVLNDAGELGFVKE